jgi:hypothetical protein
MFPTQEGCTLSCGELYISDDLLACEYLNYERIVSKYTLILYLLIDDMPHDGVAPVFIDNF